ncbi:permease [mine drainage metagenome]|uniref:Permease n=1 Tax=mine drainage metagenome TaxID=410659 RepID=T0Z8L0_9ZZZZ
MFFSITVDPAQLAVPQPDRLAVIGPSTAPGHATFISLEQYEQLRSLPGIASIGVSTFFNQVNVGAGRLPLLVYAQRVDRGYLATLAMPMALGRYFSAAEDAPHGPRAVIISHGFWLQHFGGSRAVIGKNLSINGQTTRIVGVLPKSFPKLLYTSVPLLLPLRAAPGLARDTGLIAIARLDAHTSFQQLGAEAALRMRLFFAAQGKHHVEKHPFIAEPLLRSMRAHIGGNLLALLGLVTTALLLLTGSNVVNLMLLRAQQQRHHLAIRAAMGASAWHLLLTALADSLLIVVIGCTAGLLASGLLLHALAEHVASVGFSGASYIALTGTMIVFAILIALLITSVGAITGAGARVRWAHPLHPHRVCTVARTRVRRGSAGFWSWCRRCSPPVWSASRCCSRKPLTGALTPTRVMTRTMCTAFTCCRHADVSGSTKPGDAGHADHRRAAFDPGRRNRRRQRPAAA